MFDEFLFGETTEIPQVQHTARRPVSQDQPIAQQDADSIEEDLLSAAELGYAVYSFHGHPNPLQLMRLLSSIDNDFLSERKHSSIEDYAIDKVIDILL